MDQTDEIERAIQNGYWLGQFEKMRKERDALRAENERLDQARLMLAEEREAWKERALRESASNERLRAALEQGRMLVGEMDARMSEQATEDEDGFIASYRIPVGPWHRIIGWARGAW